MRLYLDSSAAIKRAVLEAESTALTDYVDQMAAENGVLLSSEFTRVELCRSLMRLPRLSAGKLAQALDHAAGDLALEPLSSDVVALAMRLRPEHLRSLDALHLSTAVLLDVDVLVTYDQRLREAAAANGIQVVAPGLD